MVRRDGYSGTARRLPSDLRARVMGATFHSRMNERGFNFRGAQVIQDVLRRLSTAWLAPGEKP